MPEEKVIIVPDSCQDIPDKRDYSFDDYISEYSEGTINKKRPSTAIVFDQGSSLMCTRYGLTHVSNGENINEYAANDMVYEQIDPAKRWKDDGTHYLQARLTQFVKEGLIEGYVKIYSGENKLSNIKKSLDIGQFIYTGSSNGYWGQIGRSPYKYIIRPDGVFVGHSWSIVAYDDTTKLFKCINSRGPTWGDKGYFYLPYSMVNNIYSCYSIIDKSNADVFANFKNGQKVKQFRPTLSVAYDTIFVNDIDANIRTKLHELAVEIDKIYTK